MVDGLRMDGLTFVYRGSACMLLLLVVVGIVVVVVVEVFESMVVAVVTVASAVVWVPRHVRYQLNNHLSDHMHQVVAGSGGNAVHRALPTETNGQYIKSFGPRQT